MQKKKAKKKKKKKKKWESSVSKHQGNKEDKIITIGYSKQKKAAKIVAKMDEKELSLKKCKTKKKTKMPEKTPEKTLNKFELPSKQKHIRFG